MQVLSLKGIRKRLEDPDFKAITKLHKLEELVLDCDQAPAGEPGVEEMKWGLQGFPEGMEHLVNITHLTLSSHPSITHLPLSIGKLTKLQVLLPPTFPIAPPLSQSFCLPHVPPFFSLPA